MNWLNAAAVVPPDASLFTVQTTTIPPVGVALTATSRGMLLSAATSLDVSAMMAEMDAPADHWQATMLSVYSGSVTDFNLPSIAVRDAVNNRAVEFGVGGLFATTYRFDYFSSVGGVGLDSRLNDIALQDTGLPPPSEPLWSRLTYDGTNFTWAFSRDGEHFVPVYSVSATDTLTNVSKVGPAVMFAGTTKRWAAGLHILSWSVVGI